MKTSALLALFLVIFTSNSIAQSGFKLGPQASFISSRTHVTDSLPDNFNFRFKSGFKFGISAQYGFTPQFVFATGLNYSNKGYRVFNDTNSQGNLIKNNSSHLELPLNFIAKFRMGASSKMRFLFGASINYQLNTNDVVKSNKGGSFVITETSKEALYPLANLGVEIASENKAGNMFVFGVYYSQGFGNQSLLRVAGSQSASKDLFTLGYRGSYVGIGISYLFDLKNFKREEVFFY